MRIKELSATALQVVGRVVPQNPALPLQRMLRVEAREGEVELSAFDMSWWARATVPAEVVQPGVAWIPGRLACEIAGRLGSALVIERTGNQVSLGSEGSLYALPVVDNDPPEFPEPSADGQRVCVEGKELKDLVRRVAFAAATDEFRPILTGILLELTDSGIQAAATNGHMLAVSGGDPAVKAAAAIPARLLVEAVRWVPESGEVELEFDSAWCVLRAGPYRFGLRLLDGDYPNYRRLIPPSDWTPPVQVEVARSDLRAALGRLSVVGSPRVIWDLRPDGSTLSAFSFDCEAREEIPVSLTGNPISIAFNPRYLSAILGASSEPTLSVGLSTPTSPIYLRSGPTLVLLMPMELKK